MDAILQAHYPRGDTSTFPKIVGVGPPWGEIFPNFFSRDIDLKMLGSHAPDPGKNKQKKFFAPDPPGLGGVASKLLELRFLNVSTRLHATVLEISE